LVCKCLRHLCPKKSTRIRKKKNLHKKISNNWISTTIELNLTMNSAFERF
jgi:hypothetical protein